jgi:hypothetical protein
MAIQYSTLAQLLTSNFQYSTISIILFKEWDFCISFKKQVLQVDLTEEQRLYHFSDALQILLNDLMVIFCIVVRLIKFQYS